MRAELVRALHGLHAVSSPTDGDIQVKENLNFQRRNWRVQRFGWLVMAAVLVASLFGVLGRGPLASASVTSPRGTVRADYEWILRRASPTSIYLTATPVGNADTITIRVLREFLEGVEVQSILPEPIGMAGDERFIAYDFAVSDPARPLRAVFVFSPVGYAGQPVEIAVAGGERVGFRQFVLP